MPALRERKVRAEACLVDGNAYRHPASLDLSPAAFQQLAHLDVGRMQMTWHFI